jgi:signal transduction histidine kinase
MPSPSPRLTLLLLFALAAIILAGGLRLAQREESLLVDRDRAALRDLGAALHAELQRLEALYESHLARLARTLPDDAFEIRREADRVVGVRQFSLLGREGYRLPRSAPDTHVVVIPMAGDRTPVPAFDAPRAGSAREVVLLDEDRLFGDANGSGWIDEPGKPLMFWLRRTTGQCAVLMIDSTAVEAAIDGWLEQWAGSHFEPVRVDGGPDQLRTHNGRALAVAGVPQAARPDLLQAVRSRLGTWELASWDRRETRVHYSTAVLTACGTLAVLVALLGFVLAAQQREALRLAAQRVSFVNRVSHELRAPLTNIVLNTELATESLETTPHESTRRLALVREEAGRLGRLIENVLTFSQSEKGKVRIEPRACVPESVIGMVVEQFAPSFARRALDVRRMGRVAALCQLDADAFAQILANLLSNVEKYVPGGPVEIHSTLEGETLIVTVSDHGPGIPAEAAERIFRPFERLDSRINEGSTGAGLGLAIARDLAAGMGGSLRLRPSERGASFELRLPAPRAGGPAVLCDIPPPCMRA